MDVDPEVSKAGRQGGGDGRHRGRYDELVGQMAAEVHNPFNLDRYPWAAEDLPARPCGAGALFDSAADYAGGPTRGRPRRRYCTPRCASRVVCHGYGEWVSERRGRAA